MNHHCVESSGKTSGNDCSLQRRQSKFGDTVSLEHSREGWMALGSHPRF